jgi:replication factor C subunit 3/5
MSVCNPEQLTYENDLFVNRFRPRTLTELNRPQLGILKDITRQQSPPNMIFYGQRQSGKKTALYAFLRDMYGPFETSYKRVTFKSGKPISVPVFFSKYHIEIDTLSFYSQVRTVLPTLIKNLASTRSVLDKNIKLLVIHHMESLEMQTQHTLRRIIEMYADNCRFVFLTHRLNSISQPLQSRCVLVRIPLYTPIEISEALQTINNTLDAPVENAQLDRILKMDHVTMKDAVFQLEFYYHGLGVYERPIDTLRKMVTMISSTTVINHDFYKRIDVILYTCMFKNFDLYDVFYDLFRIVYPMIPPEFNQEYLEVISELDVDMTRGIREITHIQTHVYFLVDLFRRINVNVYENKKKCVQ